MRYMLTMFQILLCFFFCPADGFCALLFTETFEDSNFVSRGWYDDTNLQLSAIEHIPGSAHSVEYHFLQGTKTPAVSGGSIRRKFAETDSVYIGFYIKHSANWVGSNQPYHPHEIFFLTNLDSDYWGPSVSHLTAYVEENSGYPVLLIQDTINIDQNNIGKDLTTVTEQRATAGCNGSTNDGYDFLDCYGSSGSYRNEKKWKPSSQYFRDSPGSYYKGDWHHVEAYFKLNSIVNGKGVANGILQYWFDGILIIDHKDVIIRTGQYPNMKFNQLLIAPYIGDGSPIDQTIWIDNLTVATARPDGTIPAQPKNLRIQ